jgi:tryptophanyl-tRNA synthetase
MQRILTGIQPSGGFHLGNYFGAMRPLLEMQERGQVFALLVDLHALTSVRDAGQLRENTRRAAVDFLACGLDPARSVFFRQSDVMEHTELMWILSCVTPMGLLERCHAYKDKVARGLSANHALFAYPVLMAADILLYDADIVPVGKDQKQHLEVARDIVVKMNEAYGEVLKLPEPEIAEEVATVPGLDGQKMSKSYGNTIELFMEEKPLRKRVMSIVTDSTPLEAPKDPEAPPSWRSTGWWPHPSRWRRCASASLPAGMATASSRRSSSPPSGTTSLPRGPGGRSCSAIRVTWRRSCATEPSAPGRSRPRRWSGCGGRWG